MNVTTPMPELWPPSEPTRPLTLAEEDVLPPGGWIGQYRIEAFVGRGGMGSVYRGRHPMLERTVAIKLLPVGMARDDEFVRRFKLEAQSLAKLQHPNIVAIYDMGVQGDLYYFVMEFVEGVPLRAVLAQRGMTAEQALPMVPKLCDALAYAHTQGIVHRDIKPENILLGRSGEPKIADFGLAKVLRGEASPRGLTQTSVIMGTPDYMAPEQRECTKSVDHRADIFALGVVTYEMLTGELPVGRFAPPSRKASVDARVDAVVMRALDQDPGRRYQSAGQMAKDLTTILSRPEAARAAAEETECPLCLGTIAAGATRCPLCAGALEEIWKARARLAEVRRLAGQVFPPLPAVRWATLAWTGLLSACIASILWGSAAFQGLGWTVGVVSGVAALLYWIKDVALVTVRHRRTPEAGLKAMLRSMRMKAWEHAYAAISPAAKDATPRTLPKVPAIGMYGESYRFDLFENFRGYWSRAVGRADNAHWSMSYRIVRTWAVDEDAAVAELRIKVSFHPGWAQVLMACLVLFAVVPAVLVYLLARKRHTFEITKLVVRHGERWFVLVPELSDAEDRAILREIERAKPG